MDNILLLLSLWAMAGYASLQTAAEPPEACPERLVGDERRRTCPRPCVQDKDCGSKRQCLCDGQCGLSCVAPGRTCPWPLPPGSNLVPSLLSPTPSFSLLSPTPSFSALLEVRCVPGYVLPSGLDAAIRRCQGDRQWSGDDPICTVEPPSPDVSCPLPKEVTETFSINGTSAPGTTIRYTCLFGELVGNSENVCTDKLTWQYPHPICQRVWCPAPQEVNHGYLVAVQRSEYEVGDDIYYLCKKNFLLDGPNRVSCQPNGTWTTVPYCRARCPIPAERSRVLIGGLKRWPYDMTDSVVPHGENVTFYCKHPRKQCSLPSTQTCFDGLLSAPSCYLEPTWLQYKLFPHRLVSEIEACSPADLE
ncbi:beta-2-glycoprotein 1 [Esox lucius]|uniref:Beta-2-glycoprotein 1 n=1 Tax=Esox lucius TaxID=8010 RepID=A0A3P8YHS4_ESOLU|nr:beta-2-glycoprotein 1 [Esox lucius]